VTAAKLCPSCGRPMRLELCRRVVGSAGQVVTLWYCEPCDHAEHEVVREA
jgi:hypothetical protein